MEPHPTVTVRSFYEQHREDLGLRMVAGERGLDRLIREPTVNRPALALAGFTKYFAQHRIQVMGNAENYFLKSLGEEERAKRHEMLFRSRIPCVVFCRNAVPPRACVRLADAEGVPMFRSPMVTMRFINRATLQLDPMFAPRRKEMGSMVDILGIGVLIRGEPGIGKSECVLGLIERGYSLVSDDVTLLTVHNGDELIGTAPPTIKDYMEVRGIGLINVAATFGIKSIRTNKRLDLVVRLRRWDEVTDVDRLGLEQETISLLGIEVPFVTLPVAPGRDLARLVEVAACIQKLHMAGHHPARDFENRLLGAIESERKEPG